MEFSLNSTILFVLAGAIILFVIAQSLFFMIVLFLLVPSLSGSIGVLVLVGALIAIGSARMLYKKGLL